MEAATAVDPWTTACSPDRMIFPGALAFTSITTTLWNYYYNILFLCLFRYTRNSVLKEVPLNSERRKKQRQEDCCFVERFNIEWMRFDTFRNELGVCHVFIVVGKVNLTQNMVSDLLLYKNIKNVS